MKIKLENAMETIIGFSLEILHKSLEISATMISYLVYDTLLLLTSNYFRDLHRSKDNNNYWLLDEARLLLLNQGNSHHNQVTNGQDQLLCMALLLKNFFCTDQKLLLSLI